MNRIAVLLCILCLGASGCVSTSVLSINNRHQTFLAKADAQVTAAGGQRIPYPCVVKVSSPDNLAGKQKALVENPFQTRLYQYPIKLVLQKSFERALYRVFSPPSGNVMNSFVVEIQPARSLLVLEPGQAVYDLSCEINLRAPNDRIIKTESFSRHERSQFDDTSTPEAVWNAAVQMAVDYANSVKQDRAVYASLSSIGAVPPVGVGAVASAKQAKPVPTENLLSAIDAEIAASQMVGPRWLSPTKTRVLCVGVATYEDEGITPVRYAEKDALAFYRFVRESGIPKKHVTVLTNGDATRSQIMKHLTRLKQMTTEDDEIAILYFSGHGAPLVLNGQVVDGVIVPHDAAVDAMDLTAVRLSKLRDLLRDASGQWVVVLDACFSGKQGRSVFASRVKGLAVVPKNFKVGADQDKQWWLSATSGNLFANDFPKAEQGLFSHYLLRAFREEGLADTNRDGVVTLREAFTWADDKVKNVSLKSMGQLQKPEVTGRGDLPLVRR